MDVEDRVVVASDFTSVPPTCFNSFRVTEKTQRASAVWDTVELFQLNADAGLYDWPGYDGISGYLAHIDLPVSKVLATYSGRG